MREYFQLQYRFLSRNLREFGINPLAGFILSVAILAGLSFYLYTKTEFAPYILALAAIAIMYPLNEERRLEFLKMIFKVRDLYFVRIFENLIIAIPFLIFLLFKESYLASLGLFVLAILISFVNPHTVSNYTMPTPFGRNPFEFMVGFRKSFMLIILAYVLTGISVYINNFNLGAFSLILIFILGIGFNSNPENEYYVWNYLKKPKQFLINKTLISVLHSTLLTIPILATLIIVFSEINILMLIQLLGYLSLVVMILAKYSAYPNQINIPQGILLLFSIQFPPLLIFVLPYFYLRAVKHLSWYLHD